MSYGSARNFTLARGRRGMDETNVVIREGAFAEKSGRVLVYWAYRKGEISAR